MTFVRCFSLFIVIGWVGCAGPNRLTRGFDLKLNQLYVDSPTLAEVCLPLAFVGTNLTMAADACFINPWYFWHDAPAGHGQAYYYTDPITPDNQAVLESPKKKSDEPKDDKGKSAKDGGNDKATAKAAAPSAPPSDPPKEDRGYITYTVKEGDTFSSIAKHYYKDSHQWKKIYMANQNIVQSENRISPGQMLIIPNQ